MDNTFLPQSAPPEFWNDWQIEIVLLDPTYGTPLGVPLIIENDDRLTDAFKFLAVVYDAALKVGVLARAPNKTLHTVHIVPAKRGEEKVAAD